MAHKSGGTIMKKTISLILSSLLIIAVMSATVFAGPGGEGAMGAPGGTGDSSSTYSDWTAVTTYTQDGSSIGQTFTSTGTDENAILISEGATVTFDNATVTRTSSDSTGGDNSSFYGVGAAILAENGTAYINNSNITTDAKGGAGAFAYSDGTVYIANTDIQTEQSTSGGIHAAGAGKLYAWNVTATTQGESSAAIRSDRGGGTMVIDGGTYTSNGTGSPAIYCTADIAVNDAKLVSNSSEAICIEGLNSLSLFDCDLSGNLPDDEQNDCTWTVILYQSMSGDSEVGNSTFNMSGGTLTSSNGGIFYTTNTESTFYVNNVDIKSSDDCEFFFKCTGNSNSRGWGDTGSNGADSVFTAVNQQMTGDVIWDSISQMDFYILTGSNLTGGILDDESNAGDGGSGYANVYIDADSTWIVTKDSTLSALYNLGSITDESGKTVTITGTDGTTYVSGSSDITVTVAKYYESEFTTDYTAAKWSDYSVTAPAMFSVVTNTDDTGSDDTASSETTSADTGSETEETASETTADTGDTGDTSSEGTGSSVNITAIIIICVAIVAVIVAGIIIITKSGKKK